jgi:hypothetical protein
MDMRFALNAVENVEVAFPFGVMPPVGSYVSYLDLRINPKAQSGLALIETVFRGLVRHHAGGQVGLVKDFKANVTTRVKSQAEAEVEIVETEAGGEGSSGSTRNAKRKEKGKAAELTLEIVIGALFGAMATELNRLWTMEVLANGAVFVLPAPLLTTLLEKECCLATISDLFITLQVPEVQNTAWEYALASAAAETALKDLGFSCADFAAVQGCPPMTKARFVQSWKANGVAQSRQKKRSSPPAGKGLSNQLGKQQKRQGETASDYYWQRGGGPGSNDFLYKVLLHDDGCEGAPVVNVRASRRGGPRRRCH